MQQPDLNTRQKISQTGQLLTWLVPVFLVAACLVDLLGNVFRYGYRFPYWDEWLLTPLIAKMYEGRLTFLDFWAQHNEHRVLFPRLLFLALARLTRWNVVCELAASIVMAVAIFVLMLHLARQTAKALNRPSTPWIAVPFSFLIFSWAQMENWVWGWELVVFMNTLAVVAGVALLAAEKPSWPRFAASILLGVVASYSYAGGMLYWFAAFPAAIAAPGCSRKTRVLRAEVWIAAAVITIESYLYAYIKPTLSPSLTAALEHPAAYLGCVVLYLGGPLTGLVGTPAWHGPAQPIAMAQFIPGAIGVMAFPVLAYALWRSRKVPFAVLVPWYALAAYAVGNALLTGAGRVGFGLSYALRSQYMTTAALFWCALAALVWVYSSTADRLRVNSDALRIAGAVAAIVLVFCGNFLFTYNNRQWMAISRWKQMGWEAIQAGDEAPLYLKDLSDDPQKLQGEYLPFLKKYGLCGFGKPHPPNPVRADAFVAEAKFFIATNRWVQAATYLRTALLLNPQHAEAQTLFPQVVQVIEKLRAQQGASGKP